MDDRPDLLISGLQHFAFCRRQWALIHIEGEWEENYFTVDGAILHERADDPYATEKRGGTIVSRAMEVRSAVYGIVGKCDVVEFHRSPDGVALHGREGLWLPYPVEYKKGSDKTQEADEVQLCAQALCLEEMLCCAIPEGSLFYGEPRRRTRVALDESLRARTLSLLAELLENQARGHTPSVRAHKGCNACSLKDVCVPRLSRTGSVRAYMHARIAEDSP